MPVETFFLPDAVENASSISLRMNRPLLTSQIVILVLSFIWGVYFVAFWRTQSFGMTLRAVAADALEVLIAVVPIAVLGVVGLSWRKASVVLFAMCIGIIAVAEVYACVQERVVIRRYGDDPGRQTFLPRWPPFGDHHIGYSPVYGWFGGD